MHLSASIKFFFNDEERKVLVDFMTKYEGEKVESTGLLVPTPNHKKLDKGFRLKDIALFMSLKKQVVEERTLAKFMSSKQNADGEIAPFTFNFPELAGHIKAEPDYYSSISKRKHQVISQVTACAMPMDLETDGVYGI